jgi:hypothetical protein
LSNLFEFRPVAQSTLRRWSRPARFDFLDDLAFVPIADTELLHLSHYAPIGIRLGRHGPEVVAILHSELNTGRLLGKEGRWLPPYAPYALRCLPFRGVGLEAMPEIAEALCGTEGEQFPLLGEDGQPGKDYAYVIEMLRRLARGSLRLSNAAKLLLAADCLVALYPLESQPEAMVYVVSETLLQRFSGAQAAALTTDSNLPYEIAAASLFSQRLLRRGAVQDLPAPAPSRMVAPAMDQGHRPMIQDFQGSFEEPLMMDDSTLFSIDDFLEFSDKADERS